MFTADVPQKRQQQEESPRVNNVRVTAAAKRIMMLLMLEAAGILATKKTGDLRHGWFRSGDLHGWKGGADGSVCEEAASAVFGRSGSAAASARSGCGKFLQLPHGKHFLDDSLRIRQLIVFDVW